MKGRSLTGAGVHRRAARLAMASLVIAGSGAASGCLTRPIAPIEPVTTQVVIDKLLQSAVTKIDLVLMVDNSSSMADKQAVLALAIPDLINGLVNPSCLDASGAIVANQPTGPLEACPAGSGREFPPITDIHIGLLSSSLGTFGADGCRVTTGLNNDDQGHLLTRAPTTGSVATYQNLGFLAWDPAQKLVPPGEASIGDPTATPPVAGLATSLHDLVLGDNQVGCGFESQNESWYRFLVDPTPSNATQLTGDGTLRGSQVAVSTALDTTVTQQRQDFLRPDSLLAIINVTDENDTSIKEQSYYPVFAQELDKATETAHQYMPHARAECTDPTKGPADHCCASCGLPAPEGCPVDTACAADPSYDSAHDNFNLHAFGLGTHKARFGEEFFYPPSRYVTALTSPTVTDRTGKTVANPIYSVLDPTLKNASVRDKSLVFYATITGVPWELIARQTANGTPDLLNGVSEIDPTAIGGFKTAAELSLRDSKGHTFWDDIVGDPENYVAPLSPFMQESTQPRTGVDPITGVNIATANTINGGERPIAQPAGDIEYACYFHLTTSRDCSTDSECDCYGTKGIGNPLCGPNSNDPSGNPTEQINAKAYPGIKNLAIAKGMGDQGIAASICAAQLTDNSVNRSDYGYRPAIRAIIDRLKQVIGGQCLTRTLTADSAGQVPCLVIEARNTGGGACTCDGPARSFATDEQKPAIVEAIQENPDTASECYCVINQTLQGAAQTSCQNDVLNPTAEGWCYVDDTVSPPLGNAEIVARCPADEKREVRFVGNGVPALGATTFILCASSN